MRVEQVRLVHLVGDLVDDDRLPVALVEVLDVRARADHDAAAAGAVALAHALEAVDDAGGRESPAPGRSRSARRRVDVRVAEQREAGVDDLGQVVRRDVGRHADRDARRAVDQQVRQPRRQHRRLHAPCRRSSGRSRPFPCRCRPAARRRSSRSRHSV